MNGLVRVIFVCVISFSMLAGCGIAINGKPALDVLASAKSSQPSPTRLMTANRTVPSAARSIKSPITVSLAPALAGEPCGFCGTPMNGGAYICVGCHASRYLIAYWRFVHRFLFFIGDIALWLFIAVCLFLPIEITGKIALIVISLIARLMLQGIGGLIPKKKRIHYVR